MRLLLLAILLFAAPIAAADDLTKESERQLLQRILEKKNQTSKSVFEELGSRKTRASLNALKQGLDELGGTTALKNACRAFRHYRGETGLEKMAITTLYSTAQESKNTRTRQAAYGLAFFPVAGRQELMRLVQHSNDEITRANALEGLLPVLSESASKGEFKIVSRTLRTTPSLTRAKGVKAFKAFLKNGGPKLFKDTICDSGLRLEVRRMIIDALVPSKDTGVVPHLLEGLEADEASLVHELLLGLATRGCDDYGKYLRRLTRSKDAAIRREALVAQARILGGDPTFFDKLLDQAGDDDRVMRSAAAISLGTIKTTESLAALHELLNDDDYSVRFQALDAAYAARHVSSIGPLIARLKREHGTLRPVLLKRLRLLTGMGFGNSDAVWHRWWEDHEEEFELPTLEVAITAEEERGERKAKNTTRASFYGLRIVSDRLCFVIDNSGSMKNKTKSGKTRLSAMQEQLVTTLGNLPDAVLLNLVFFAVVAEKWEDKLQILNTTTRADAIRKINGIGMQNQTVTYEGLMAGLSDPRVDTIYLLTDGQPVGGMLPKTSEILHEIRRHNSVRHVVIHCISVGRDSAFLKKLAEQNHGQYTRVD